MAHFAELDSDNKVIRVIVVGNPDCLDSNGQESEAVGIAFSQSLYGFNTRWAQTSYNGTIRGKYAETGDTFDENAGLFVAPELDLTPLPSEAQV